MPITVVLIIFVSIKQSLTTPTAISSFQFDYFLILKHFRVILVMLLFQQKTGKQDTSAWLVQSRDATLWLKMARRSETTVASCRLQAQLAKPMPQKSSAAARQLRLAAKVPAHRVNVSLDT